MLNKQAILIEAAYLTHQMFEHLTSDDFESFFDKHDKRSVLLSEIVNDYEFLQASYDEFKSFCELNAKLTTVLDSMQEDTANQLTIHYKSKNIRNTYGI